MALGNYIGEIEKGIRIQNSEMPVKHVFVQIVFVCKKGLLNHLIARVLDLK